ncbi:hypothetical protein A1F94_006662 [Pyrenophora tritici-repentis]|nr:hypothetical protein A1F94_006662 [Pyrenophora tritici-repentis]
MDLMHVRGRDELTTYTHTHSPDVAATDDVDSSATTTMSTTKHFCKTCGTLMYSVGSHLPDRYILYLNTVDDALRADKEMKSRVVDEEEEEGIRSSL